MQQVLYYSQFKDPAVDWVFTFLSAALGCTFHPATEPRQASILYSNEQGKPGQFHIPHWREYYESSAEHSLSPHGYWVPSQMAGTSDTIDYIGLVFRLLTLVDEMAVAADDRNEFGNITANSHLRRGEFGDMPMVDRAVQELKQKLIDGFFLKESGLIARWPEGKRFAVLITHDTDGPCLLEAKELAKAGLKGLLRWNGAQRSAFFEGCRRILTGGEDPYFNFTYWAEFEQTLGARSAFYIYVNSKEVPGHIHNPLYRIDKRNAKWNILHELAERGWEIGLHSSIHALEKDYYLLKEKRVLEHFLGGSIAGNRCHYWTMNWRNLDESFRYMEAAGIKYDCSVAWKDMPGFRSGTVTPYHPFSPQKGEGLNVLEIPTNVMDGHLFEYATACDPHALFATIVERVKAYGGVLNLDWHTRTWVDKYSYAGWRSFLVKEIGKLASSGEAWFTTPKHLTAYWLTRESQLEDN